MAEQAPLFDFNINQPSYEAAGAIIRKAEGKVAEIDQKLKADPNNEVLQEIRGKYARVAASGRGFLPRRLNKKDEVETIKDGLRLTHELKELKGLEIEAEETERSYQNTNNEKTKRDTSAKEQKETEENIFKKIKEDTEDELKTKQANDTSLVRIQTEEALRDKIAQEKRDRKKQPKYNSKLIDAFERLKGRRDTLKERSKFVPETSVINNPTLEDKEISRRRRIREETPNPYAKLMGIPGDKSQADFSYNEMPGVFRNALLDKMKGYLPDDRKEAFLKNNSGFFKDHSSFLQDLETQGVTDRTALNSLIDEELNTSSAAKKEKEEGILKELHRSKRRENKPAENARLLREYEAKLEQAVHEKKKGAVDRLMEEISKLRPDASEAEQLQYAEKEKSFGEALKQKNDLQYQNLKSLDHPKESDDKWAVYQRFLAEQMTPKKIGYKQKLNDLQNRQMNQDDVMNRLNPMLQEEKLENDKLLRKLLNNINRRHRQLGTYGNLDHDLDKQRARERAAKQFSDRSQDLFQKASQEAQEQFNKRQLNDFAQIASMKRKKETEDRDRGEVMRNLRYSVQNRTRKNYNALELALKNRYGEQAFNLDKR